MQKALALACETVDSKEGGPFGAVIARNGEIVGEGRNRVLKSKDPTAHAEILAIRDACERLDTFDLSGCEIYASSEPCPMCLGAIYWSCLSRVYYANPIGEADASGFRDDFIFEELRLPSAQRSLSSVHLQADNPTAAFDRWRANGEEY